MDETIPRQNNFPKQAQSLLFVVAAVDVSPVPEMGQYIPTIQSALRLSGYPLSEMTTNNEILVGPQGVQTQVSQQWAFYDVRKTFGVRISSSRFVIETTAYTSFAEFIPRVEPILEILAAPGLMAVQRIGLRYINVIQPQEGESFEDYLHDRLSGLREDFLGLTDPTFSLAVQGHTEEGMLSIRSHQPPIAVLNPDHILMPADLGTQLTFPNIVNPSVRYRFLDLDHFSTPSEEYSPKNLVGALDRLHHTVGRAFKDSLQDSTYKTWAKQ